MPLRLLLAALAALLLLPATAAARDETIASFDGTPIVLHWFPQPGVAPTVLQGPGWGSGGETDPGGSIKDLLGAGYNVLTWDPRGFGASGGVVTIDSKDVEGRDVQRLIDWVAGQPETQLDGPGDPRMGMAGGSYGGGIQLVVAAIDKRVDAIVPTIAWHSLRSALYRSRLVKQGWAGRLYQTAQSRPLDPHIKAAYDQGVASGSLTGESERWFAGRGPGDALVDRIRVPTLIQQGTVDTLFTLDEAIANYRRLRRNGVPVKLLWFCGGHGVCLTGKGDGSRVPRSTLAWLDRYVKRDASVETGPGFDWIDQRGRRFADRRWPVRAGRPLRGAGRGRLRLVAAGGSGPATAPADADIVGQIAAGITPARARNAVEVAVRARRAATVVGAPRLALRYRGRATGAAGRPERVFAQLVDDRTGHVLGNQITPIPVRLDGRTHTVRRRLETVAHSLARGSGVTLQLVASTVAYAAPRLGGRITFERARVVLPTRRR